ncbi:type II secretion system F family protein [Candidatus Saccharibacteria bacterium]|nr:type II secretion system F family protein [Candidatus Saccharibacteria bacterium]
MLEFSYSARDTASNKQVRSTVKAESEKAAAKLLMAQGLMPLKISELSEGDGLFAKFRNRVSAKERVVFTRQLATLINAGLPLAQSLHTVRDQTVNKKLQSVAQDIVSSIEGGSTLSGAFAKHGDIFNDVFVALVSAGEASGTLDRALERIADQQEKDAEIMGKIKGAMMYPLIVSFVMVGVIVFMLVTVVPQVGKLYKDLKQELPLLTKIMVGTADFVQHYWYIVLVVVAILIYFAHNWIRTESGRRVVDSFKLNVPLFGVLFRKLYMARFARTAETLMSTGVPMLETLNITKRAVNNTYIADAITRASDKVRGGKALSLALKNEDYVLPLVPQMISIGEQSGGIDAMLGKAATFYENELDQTIRSISTMIEPIMMVMLAGVAGVMIGAVLFPIYALVGNGGVR